MEKIIGLIDAPFTPFYENGEVNYEPIEAYAKMLQKNGLQGVFINGSSGEGYMLTEEERMKLAERWVSLCVNVAMCFPSVLPSLPCQNTPLHQEIKLMQKRL